MSVIYKVTEVVRERVKVMGLDEIRYEMKRIKRVLPPAASAYWDLLNEELKKRNKGGVSL